MEAAASRLSARRQCRDQARLATLKDMGEKFVKGEYFKRA